MNQLQREYFDNLKEQNQGMSNQRPWKIFYRDFKTDLEVLLHYHDSLEINYSINVTGTIRVGNRVMNLEEHPVIILSPDTLHSYHIQRNPGRMLVVHISLKDLNNYLNVPSILNELRINPNLLPVTSTSYASLIPILERLASSHKTIERVAEILHMFNALEGISTNSSYVNPNSTKMNRIVEFTESNFNKHINLDTVSTYFNLSKSYFCRYFKQQTGFSYWDYLIYVRLEHAKKLLSNGSQVAEACYACGFDDISYFIKMFKTRIGVTPGQFKK